MRCLASSAAQRFEVDYKSSVFRIYISHCVEQTYIYYRTRALDQFTTKSDFQIEIILYVASSVWSYKRPGF
jgi:hypothetical protein